MAAEIQGGSCLVWRSPGDVAALPARQGVSECLPGGTLGWGEGVCLSVCLQVPGVSCAPPCPCHVPRSRTELFTLCLTPFSKWNRALGSAGTPAGNAARLPGLAKEPQNAHTPLHMAWDVWLFLPRPHPDAVGTPRPCPVAVALLGVAAGLQQNHIVRANPVAPLCQPRGPFRATKSHEAAPASPSVELPGAVSPRTLCWHAAFIGAVHSAQAGNILQPARILPGRGRTGSAASLPRSSARAARRGGKVIAFLGAGWEEKNKIK